MMSEREELERLVHEQTKGLKQRKRVEEILKYCIPASTHPSIDISNLKLTDIINVTLLQELQDEFASCHGVASLIFSASGEPITEPSNFSEFCTLLRSTEKGRANCMRSDSRLAKETVKGKPAITHCQNFQEILDGAVPIFIGELFVASWGIGQVLTTPLDEQRVRQYAREVGLEEAKLVAASKKLNQNLMPRTKFKKLIDFMAILAEDISLLGLQNLQQAHVIAELEQTEEALYRYMEELERFNRLAVGRELRMIELKREVNQLCERLGEKQPYDLSFVEDTQSKRISRLDRVCNNGT